MGTDCLDDLAICKLIQFGAGHTDDHEARHKAVLSCNILIYRKVSWGSPSKDQNKGRTYPLSCMDVAGLPVGAEVAILNGDGLA